MSLRKEQVEILEKVAVVFEKTGMQPAMAKILALLIVNDEPDMTFDEIWQTLEISKSAASQAINQLLSMNKIIYKTKIGDRKRYFSSRLVGWQEQVKSNLSDHDYFTSLLQQILDQRPADTVEFNGSLKKLIAFLNFLSREMPALYRKFEAENE